LAIVFQELLQVILDLGCAPRGFHDHVEDRDRLHHHLDHVLGVGEGHLLRRLDHDVRRDFQDLQADELLDLRLLDDAQVHQHLAELLSLPREEGRVLQVLLGDTPLTHQALAQALAVVGGPGGGDAAVSEDDVPRDASALAGEDAAPPLAGESSQSLQNLLIHGLTGMDLRVCRGSFAKDARYVPVRVGSVGPN
jgi:hypothetical protein